MKFQTIYFRRPKRKNQPLRAYQVGLMGCESINEIKNSDGSYSYLVTFSDGEKKLITNTILVIE